MDNVLEIKLPITLPELDPQARATLMVAMEEMYRRGYADAKDNLCAGCGYKSYYSQVAALGDCNDCGKARSCQYVPRPGSIVRINCPLWRAKG